MRATVQALGMSGIRLQDDPSTIALELWAAAHGVAAMLIAKPHLPFGEVGGVRRPGVSLGVLSDAWWSVWLARTWRPRSSWPG